MNTKTLIVAGALAALGYYFWRRQRETVVPSPASKLQTFATNLTGGIRLSGERHI